MPPEVPPKDYEEYAVEVLARKRVQDNARDLICGTIELKLVLPPCPQPRFPATDPLGAVRPSVKSVTGAASREVMAARIPRDSGAMRFWMQLLLRYN